MATAFVPLTGQLIDEGEFIGDLNLELAELQDAIVKYCRLHGEKAKGAVAALDIKIAIKVENVDDQAYSVKTSIKATHPKRPASISLAMGGTGDDGKRALFVRKSGSDESNPRQMKLATKDGRAIDLDTGVPTE
jgi:hypothetical protein